MRRRRTISDRAAPSILIAPLIDIVFLLLIFFMLVTKFLSPSIAVTLPDSVTSDMDETKHVTITITEPGGIFLDDSQISMDEITTRLNGLRNSGEVGQVRLRADKTVDWEFIIEALDSIREAGISDVAFETDKEEES